MRRAVKIPRVEGVNQDVWSKALQYGGYADSEELLVATLNCIATTLCPQSNDLSISTRAVIMPSIDSPNATIKPVIAYLSDPQNNTVNNPQLLVWLAEAGCAQVRNHYLYPQGAIVPSDGTSSHGLAYLKLLLDVPVYIAVQDQTTGQFEISPPLNTYTVGREVFAVATTKIDGPPPTSTLQPGTCSTGTAEYSGTMYNLTVSSLVASDPTRKGIMGASINGGIVNILGDRIKLVMAPVEPSLNTPDTFTRASGNILENAVLTGAASSFSQPYGAPSGSRAAALIGPWINCVAADEKPPNLPIDFTGATVAALPVTSNISAKVVTPLVLNTRTTGNKVFVPVQTDVPTLRIVAKVQVAIGGSQEPSGPYPGVRVSGEVHVIIYYMQATSDGIVLACETRRYIVEALGSSQNYPGLSVNQSQTAYDVNPVSWYPTNAVLPVGLVVGQSDQLLYQASRVTGGSWQGGTYPATGDGVQTTTVFPWKLAFYHLPTELVITAQFPSKYWTYFGHFVACTNNGGYYMGGTTSPGILAHPFSAPNGLESGCLMNGNATYANFTDLLQCSGTLGQSDGETAGSWIVNTCLHGVQIAPDWTTDSTVCFQPGSVPANVNETVFERYGCVAMYYSGNGITGAMATSVTSPTSSFARSIDLSAPQLVFTEILEIHYLDGRYYQPGYNTATFTQVEGMPQGCSLVRKSTHWCQMVPDAKLVRDGNVNMIEFAQPDGVKTDTINLLHSLFRSNLSQVFAYGYTEANYTAMIKTVAESMFASSPAEIEEKLAIFASASGTFGENKTNMHNSFASAGLMDAMKWLYKLYETNPLFKQAVEQSAGYLARKVRDRITGYLGSDNSGQTAQAAIEFRPSSGRGTARNRLEEANYGLRRGNFPLNDVNIGMSTNFNDDEIIGQRRPGGGASYTGVRETTSYPYAAAKFNQRGNYSASGLFGASASFLTPYSEAAACGKCGDCENCPNNYEATGRVGQFLAPMSKKPQIMGINRPSWMHQQKNSKHTIQDMPISDLTMDFTVDEPSGYWGQNDWINQLVGMALPPFGVGLTIADASDPNWSAPLGRGYEKHRYQCQGEACKQFGKGWGIPSQVKGTWMEKMIDPNGEGMLPEQYQWKSIYDLENNEYKAMQRKFYANQDANALKNQQEYAKLVSQFNQEKANQMRQYLSALRSLQADGEEKLGYENDAGDTAVTGFHGIEKVARYGPYTRYLLNTSIDPAERLAVLEQLSGTPKGLLVNGASKLENLAARIGNFFGRNTTNATNGATDAEDALEGGEAMDFGGFDPAVPVMTSAPSAFQEFANSGETWGEDAADIAADVGELAAGKFTSIGERASATFVQSGGFEAAGTFQTKRERAFFQTDGSFQLPREANTLNLRFVTAGLTIKMKSVTLTQIKNLESLLDDIPTECARKKVRRDGNAKSDKISFPKSCFMTVQRFLDIAKQIVPKSDKQMRCLIEGCEKWFKDADAYMKKVQIGVKELQGDVATKILDKGSIYGKESTQALSEVAAAVSSYIFDKTIYNSWTNKEEKTQLSEQFFQPCYASASNGTTNIILVPLIFCPYGYERENNRNYVTYPGKSESMSAVRRLVLVHYLWKAFEKTAKAKGQSKDALLMTTLWGATLITPTSKVPSAGCTNDVTRIASYCRYLCQALLVKPNMLQELKKHASECTREILNSAMYEVDSEESKAQADAAYAYYADKMKRGDAVTVDGRPPSGRVTIEV